MVIIAGRRQPATFPVQTARLTARRHVVVLIQFYMSARKATIAGSFNEVTVQARQTQLLLSPGAVVIRKNGIEFRSPTPFPAWTEMTLTLQSPEDSAPVNCAGVVVACSGNRHSGYVVSVVFTSLTRQAQARLSALSYSTLA
jgi:hypothetical protein